jgi:D-alanyl-D-alanine dipeptidase
MTRAIACNPTRAVRAGFALAAVAMLVATPAAAGKLPPGFVYLRDVKPSILQDMRYASSDNFTGRPLPGYDAAECVLRRDVAQALARVQAELLLQNLTLKTYDCYRPVRAVRAFVRWAYDRKPPGASKRFFPGYDKRTLFNRGFIAAHSRHSTGTAVDLTLVPLPPPAVKPYDPKADYAACTAPAPWRAPDNSLDMGTGYDCFDARSHTRSKAIDTDQRRRRERLVKVMRRYGFRNYFREWWHFSYYGGGPPRAWDFPITPIDPD